MFLHLTKPPFMNLFAKFNSAILLSFLLIIITLNVSASVVQDTTKKFYIGFEKDSINITLNDDKPLECFIGIKCIDPIPDGKYIKAYIDFGSCTNLSVGVLDLNTRYFVFDKNNSGTQYFKIKIPADAKKEIENKKLCLELKISDSNVQYEIFSKKMVIDFDVNTVKYDFARLYTGTNLDFLGKNSLKLNFYGEFDYYNPNLINNWLGVYSGVYQSKSLSPDSSFITQYSQYVRHITDTTAWFVDYTFDVREKPTVTAFGFFINPTINLFTKLKSTNKSMSGVRRFFSPSTKGTQLLLQFHLEFVRRTFESLVNVSNIVPRDSSIEAYSINSYSNPITTGDRVYARSQNEYYNGIGLILNSVTDKLNFKVSASLGISNLPLNGVYDINFKTYFISGRFDFFYWNTRLNVTYLPLGIDVGGEVRTSPVMFKAYNLNTEPLHNAGPYYTFFISKTFNMEKLSDYLK